MATRPFAAWPCDLRKAVLEISINQSFARFASTSMDRLYVLRNQLVHGGATYASKVNRQQVADGAAILGDIVPLVLSLMLRNASTPLRQFA